MMRLVLKIIMCLTLTLVIMPMHAQSAGDRLYQKGQQFQKTMTYKGQKSAISYFTQAKKAYDSADKKTMCDNAIQVCWNTIKAAPWKKRVVKNTGVEDVNKQDLSDKEKADTVPAQEVVDTTRISLSKSSLEYNSKEHTETIRVDCNRSDWQINNEATWITITQNGNEVTLSIMKNKEKNDRSCILRVVCGSKTAELKIVQHRWKSAFEHGKEKIMGK